MNDGILIGIDAGTSVIKSVAFAPDGTQLAVAAIANAYDTHSDGGVEQDMGRTWASVAATLRELGERIPGLASRVIALSVTAQGDGMWLIDKAGEPVGPASIWLDNRAAPIIEDYVATPEYAAHYERTGTGLTVVQMSGKLAWMQRHRPEMLARATHAFHCKDWIYFRLTGSRVTDPSEANFTFGNFRTLQYQPDILDHLGCPDARRLLTPVVDGTVDCGKLTAAAARETGLKDGTPVCLGYIDIVCSGLGGGLFDPSGRSGCTIVGSTGMHQRLRIRADDVQLNDERSGFTTIFPVPGMVAQMQSNMASTLNIDWLLDVAAGLLAEHGTKKSRAELLAGMDARIMDREPSRLLYHPYISRAGERGPFMDLAARASFNGLDTTTTYDDMMRAVFEGLAFASRDCYAVMGPVPQEVRMTGGAARSAALRLILASALNAEVRSVTREEAGAAGAAMIAAVQQGIFTDMAACAAQWIDPHLGPPVKPDAALARTYDTVFPHYVTARKALRPVWRALRDKT
ncbi:MAG: carbohydrate kinase [Rhizobiales bacterium]|nr:carbohydrate kinase [Hyphomicrobiales bacterium]